MPKSKFEPWFVYGLHDPRSRTIFYVGISAQPTLRLRQHRTDPGSAAYPRYREILAAGEEPQLILFMECKTRDHARHIERRLVEEHQGMANRHPGYSAAARAANAARKPVFEAMIAKLQGGATP